MSNTEHFTITELYSKFNFRKKLTHSIKLNKNNEYFSDGLTNVSPWAQHAIFLLKFQQHFRSRETFKTVTR